MVSDGTLVLNFGALEGGTLATVLFAVQMKKPHLVLQLDEISISDAVIVTLAWLSQESIGALNIAGPRESKRPGIYGAALRFLDAIQASILHIS